LNGHRPLSDHPQSYKAPIWLPGGHLQTIWPALYGKRALQFASTYVRERWQTPDLDFIDVDWKRVDVRLDSETEAKRPLMVLFHGLEGSSQSHYALALSAFANQQGWDFAVPHFRGCSGEINLAPRAYHSGDHQEVHWILQRMRKAHDGPLLAVGVSLGGNALLRWAEEQGEASNRIVDALSAVCSPIDLAAGGWALGRGINRAIYTPMFLKTMKPKAMQNWNNTPACSISKPC